MNEHHHKATHTQEELVAYLDGELSARERKKVEHRLAEDAGFRKELSRLQQSWEMLEALPRAGTNHELTQSTIAMVTQSEHKGSSSGPTSNAWSNFSWRGGAALAAAAMLGFALIRIPAARERTRQLRDLPVVSNLDLYRYAEDVQFLEQLREEGLFSEE